MVASLTRKRAYDQTSDEANQPITSNNGRPIGIKLSESEWEMFDSAMSNDYQKLRDEEDDGLVAELSTQNGLTATEFFEATETLLQAFNNLDNGKQVFETSLKSSLQNILKDTMTKMSEQNSNTETTDLKITTQDFLDKATKLVNERANSPTNINSEYLLSLRLQSVEGSTRALAIYFKFLSDYCPQQQLTGFSIENFLTMSIEDRLAKFRDLLNNFVLYLRHQHKTGVGKSKAKQSELLEPGSVMCYSYRLIVAFKLIGIIPHGIKNKAIMGGDTRVQIRATAKELNSNSPITKLAFTPIDAVELVKDLEFGNLTDIQYATMLLVSCETGLRVSSMIGLDAKYTGDGLKLSDLRFRFLGDKKFKITIDVPREKGDASNSSKRKLDLYSDARYNHINAANLLLVMVSTFGYTTTSLAQIISDNRLEFKESCKDLPLFCNEENLAVQPGEKMLNDKRLWDWVSKLTSIPRLFLGNRSSRKGNATGLMNNELLNDSNATKNDIVQRNVEGGNWKTGKYVSNYLAYSMGEQLVNYRVMNAPIEEKLLDIINESNLCSIFKSEKFESMKLDDQILAFFKRSELTKVDREVESIKQKSIHRQKIQEIKERYPDNLKANGDFQNLKVLSEEDKTAYDKYNKAHRKEMGDTREAIGTVFKNLIDQIRKGRWQTTVETIMSSERYVPSKLELRADLDFAMIEDQLKDAFIPTSFKDITYLYNFKEVPSNGFPCPLSLKPTRNFKSYTDFSNHAVKDHGLNKSLTKPGNGKYHCHAPGCDPNKELAQRSLTSHNQIKHGWSYFCTDCDKSIGRGDLKKHMDANPNHSIKYPWEFKVFILPVIDSRCHCIRQIANLPANLNCVTQLTEIQSHCTAGSILDLLVKLKNKNSSSPLSASKIAIEYAARFLKTEESQLPNCIVALISRLN